MSGEVLLIERRGRIAVWTMNNPQKLNCLNAALLAALRQAFADAAPNPEIGAVILTGAGRYFSSGAAFGDVGLRPTWLSQLHEMIAALNVGIFSPFINFPKPIFIAANGPAVGGATTLMLLCDAVLAAPGASFYTPFKQLGITPEGCSTITFAAKMGIEGARRMLEEGEKLSAAEASRLGFVDVLLNEGEDVVEAALEFADAWLGAGRGRLLSDQWQVAERNERNHMEAHDLADSVFGAPFLEAQLGMPPTFARKVVAPLLRALMRARL